MWFRKASPRRQAIREDVAEAEDLGKQQQKSHGRAPMLLIAFIFFLGAALVQFWPGQIIPYQVGERPGMDLITPVRFTVADDAETEQLKKSVRELSPPVLWVQQAAFDQLLSQLSSLRQDVQGAATLADVPQQVRDRFAALTEGALHQLQQADPQNYTVQIRTLVYRVLPTMPIVSHADFDLMHKKHSRSVALVGIEKDLARRAEVDWSHILIPGQVTEAQRTQLRAAVGQDLPQELAGTVTAYLLTAELPTFQYDLPLTETLADKDAAERVEGPRTYEANQVIARRDKPLTAYDCLLISRAQTEAAQTEKNDSPVVYWLGRLALIATVGILTVAGALYVVRMNAAARTVRRGWAVCLLLLGMIVIGRAAVGYFPQSLYAAGLAPTLLTAIILVIAYNQRFALGMGALHGLLMTLTLRQGFEFYLTLLTGVAVFSFGLTEIRTRGKLIEMGAWTGGALFLAVLAVGMSRMMWSPWNGHPDVRVVIQHAIWASASGLGVAIIALAALPSIERIFRITTAMTLLELCDANKPLLRRLSQEAPGTFNHSLTVGIMAEAAGNAIAANGLLCRVGAYYHDVGKLSKPGYFIENQRTGGPNRHDKLSPAMSLLIIVGHVKDGVELAREYALPWIAHQFIEQHHGTTLVEYFFHAARKKAEQGDEGVVVQDTEFRYPGPKPQTREAAIVMICDACESAVRAIDEPTAGRIESAVHSIVTKRLMDGQFNECDLTLRDLSRIEETLSRTLAAVHHGRVAYPSDTAAPTALPA